MKIIILRHEERENNVGFFSKLTNDGYVRACTELPNKLAEYNINYIFSSPFVRTLETSLFVSIKNNLLINPEYALCEYLHNSYFIFNKWYYSTDEIKDELIQQQINHSYDTLYIENDFTVLEDEKALETRIVHFFDYLYSTYDINSTVLLVTHQGVINKICDLFIKPTEMSNHFPMGHFEIFDL